jgi:hypothetical protein
MRSTPQALAMMGDRTAALGVKFQIQPGHFGIFGM